MSVGRFVGRILLLGLVGLGLFAAGCDEACEQLKAEACLVQETGSAECDKEAKAGNSGPREAVCERALILYRSQEKN